MHYLNISQQDATAIVKLKRGKVNALNESLVEELRDALTNLENDQNIKSIVLTGQGKFFSFGFDIPEFMHYSKKEFARYLTKFADLYTYAFLYPKPVIAALNGHAIAGGCILALSCDYRILVSGKAKIGLNEITFGSSLSTGIIELLRFWVGSAKASSILLSGELYNAEKAEELGLVDMVSTESNLITTATSLARQFGNKANPAFRNIKKNLRKSVVAAMRAGEDDSIREVVDIWYSEKTRENLNKIKIR